MGWRFTFRMAFSSAGEGGEPPVGTITRCSSGCAFSWLTMLMWIVGAQVGAAMRVHRALGPAGRPRGVVDRDRVGLVLEVRLARLLRARGEQLLVRVVLLA